MADASKYSDTGRSLNCNGVVPTAEDYAEYVLDTARVGGLDQVGIVAVDNDTWIEVQHG